MTIAVITGTRPEIIKMFPIIKQFEVRSIEYKYIHTGQHYDYNLFLKFVKEFKIRRPDILISLDFVDQVQQISAIIKEVGAVLKNFKPSVVIVQGDTNSVLGAALATLKSHIPIAHIEAGLRSNDWKTVEEHNRRIVDHISDILFSPTEGSSKNLKQENVYGQIHTVGNTVIDAIKLCFDENNNEFDGDNPSNFKEKDSISNLIDKGAVDEFVLVTMHRSENVDNLNNLSQVLGALSDSKLTCLFPMHPHTMKKIKEYGLTTHIGNNIKIVPPLGYFDFLKLLQRSKFVITDSGGVQEEITSPNINKRALILRDCTERPESVESGHSVLCKIEHEAILKHIEELDTKPKTIKCVSPYGNGDSANKITSVLEKKYAS